MFTRATRHHFHLLIMLYPRQLYPTAIRGCFVRLLCDVTIISGADLRHLGPVDMVIAGWPCHGHSCAGTCQTLEDSRSRLLWDLIRLMQWWFARQHFLSGYIFENVFLLEDSQDKVLEGQNYVCQHLGDPIFVNAMSLGSYAHQPRWIWTNLASLSTLATTFCAISPPFYQKVDDILDPN